MSLLNEPAPLIINITIMHNKCKDNKSELNKTASYENVTDIQVKRDNSS